MSNRALGALCALAMVGCAQAHATDEVQPGIYELRVEADAEACSPSRATGAMGSVGVLVEDGVIDAPVPELEMAELTAPRVELAPHASFHAETNRRVPGCDAWVHEEWTVMASDAEGFEVLHMQDWTGLADCAGAPERMAGAPEADCTSERRLHYALASACRAPCRLVLAAGGAVDCACE